MQFIGSSPTVQGDKVRCRIRNSRRHVVLCTCKSPEECRYLEFFLTPGRTIRVKTVVGNYIDPPFLMEIQDV